MFLHVWLSAALPSVHRGQPPPPPQKRTLSMVQRRRPTRMAVVSSGQGVLRSIHSSHFLAHPHSTFVLLVVFRFCRERERPHTKTQYKNHTITVFKSTPTPEKSEKHTLNIPKNGGATIKYRGESSSILSLSPRTRVPARYDPTASTHPWRMSFS